MSLGNWKGWGYWVLSGVLALLVVIIIYVAMAYWGLKKEYVIALSALINGIAIVYIALFTALANRLTSANHQLTIAIRESTEQHEKDLLQSQWQAIFFNSMYGEDTRKARTRVEALLNAFGTDYLISKTGMTPNEFLTIFSYLESGGTSKKINQFYNELKNHKDYKEPQKTIYPLD